MKDKLWSMYFGAKAKAISFFYDEKGETNIIAIILIIIIVIALAIIFRDRIGAIVGSLFDKADQQIGTFDGTPKPTT